MKSLFEPEVLTEIKDRINSLQTVQKPLWGEMTVDQMLVHCQKPLELALQKIPPPKAKLIFKLLAPLFKSSMYNDKPWKNNLPTIPAFKIEGTHNFQQEKKKLLALAQEFHAADTTALGRHPFFGKFTLQQWGQLQYKHLDHHLRQFEV